MLPHALISSLATIVIFASLTSGLAAASIEVSNGQLISHKDFSSEYVASRDVHVWLPDHYDEKSAGGEKFAVLYMHDGQMLFDARSTWNKQEWGVDEVAGKLMDDGLARNFIVVGVDNGGSDLRHVEYFPQKPFEEMKKTPYEQLYPTVAADDTFVGKHQEVYSDRYLKFLVEELKPFIDAEYAVLTDKDNTYVMGSSMGGLISLYAISEYPDVYGAAACLSTHWPGALTNLKDANPIPAFFFDYMRSSLPESVDHRIYFDLGTATLDAHYPPLQKQADKIMHTKGYSEENWQTALYEGAEHTEDAWRARLHIPLLFLFRN